MKNLIARRRSRCAEGATIADRDWNRAKRSPKRSGESILSASGSRATPFFLSLVSTVHAEPNSPERERGLYDARSRLRLFLFHRRRKRGRRSADRM